MAKIVFLCFLLCATLAVGEIKKDHQSLPNLNNLFRFHEEPNSLQHDFVTKLQKSRSCEPQCQNIVPVVVGPSIQTNQTAQKPVVPSGRVNVTSPRPSFPSAPSITNDMNVITPVNVVGPSIQTNATKITGLTQLPGTTVLYEKQPSNAHDSESKLFASTNKSLPDSLKMTESKNGRSAENYTSEENVKANNFIINISAHKNRAYNDIEIIQNGHNFRLNNSNMAENLQKLFDSNDTYDATPVSGYTHVNITAIPRKGQLLNENIMEYIRYDPERLANYELYLKNYRLYAADRNNTGEVPGSLQIQGGRISPDHFNISDKVNKKLKQENRAEIANLNYNEDLEDIADVRALLLGENLDPKNQYKIKVDKFKFAGDGHGFKSNKLKANVSLSLPDKHRSKLTDGGHLFGGQNLTVLNIDLKGSGIVFNEEPVSKNAQVRLVKLKT